MASRDRPILILGAGINGAAIARQLAVSGQGVVVVDTADMAFGATAYSSRLIHGGLRYLEYGEFDLVRESLGERTRLLRLAPQYVRPLRLWIPVENRLGGTLESAARFLGRWLPIKPPQRRRSRGLWLIRMGLMLYDVYARDDQLPRRHSARLSRSGGPQVDPARYRWLCSYYDAQVHYPERFVVALLEDARAAAAASGVRFDVYNYHRAVLEGRCARIEPVGAGDVNGAAPRATPSGDGPMEFEPAAVINATGAWVDHTLARLKVPSSRLMGGTKGSHIITSIPRLRELIGGDALYAEAEDGRPVFVLPLGETTMIGTTDERFEGDPADAVATEREIEYLVDTVNQLFPDVRMTADEIDLHYSGVRPLPYVPAGATSGITRRHSLVRNNDAALPLYSVIGGKLTTSRALAEEVGQRVLLDLGEPQEADTRNRLVPGAANYPATAAELTNTWRRIAKDGELDERVVRATWDLLGTRSAALLQGLAPHDRVLVSGTSIPLGVARWIIRHEWVGRLEDLVERRLMLLYDPCLSLASLEELAGLLVEAGHLRHDEVDQHVARVVHRLQTHFGKRVLVGAAR